MSAEQERAAVVAWLREQVLITGETPWDGPVWRSVLWSMFHPIKFAAEHAQLMTFLRAADAIERGDHLPTPRPIRNK